MKFQEKFLKSKIYVLQSFLARVAKSSKAYSHRYSAGARENPITEMENKPDWKKRL